MNLNLMHLMTMGKLLDLLEQSVMHLTRCHCNTCTAEPHPISSPASVTHVCHSCRKPVASTEKLQQAPFMLIRLWERQH